MPLHGGARRDFRESCRISAGDAGAAWKPWTVAQKPRHQEIRFKIQKLAWEIVNDLRPLPDLPLLSRILHVLLAEDDKAYATAAKRHDELGRVVDLLGRMLTPAFQKVIRGISRVNIAAMMDRGFEKPEPRNAPGSLIC